MANDSVISELRAPSQRLAFAVAYSSLLAFAFVFQSLPPVLRMILSDLRLDYSQGGLLMGLFALPGILLTIPGGWLADRIGLKKVGIGSLILMICGTLIVTSAGDFLFLGIGRVISGIGSMVLIVTAASLISTTFRGPKLGIAMGFYNTGMPLGTILAFNLLGAISPDYGWRIAVLVPILVCVIALALIMLWREPKLPNHKSALKRSLISAGGRIWILGLVWLWFNAAAISFLTFAPDYFSSLKFDESTATFLASSLMWGALIVSPAVGAFMTGPSRKKRLIIAGSIIPALIYIAIPLSTTWLLPLIITLGLAASLLPPPLFALPAEIVGKKQQGIAFGVLSTCLNIGILLGPFLVGLSRDQTGSFKVGFLLMGLFSLLAALSIIPLLRRNNGSFSAKT